MIELQQEIDSLGPWFHNLHLQEGVQTAPEHFLGDFPRCQWEQIAPHIPEDLTGWSVLDIGCNAGFYTFELARRGAEVTAIDVDPHYLKQARWAAERLGLAERITFRQMQVYDLARESKKYDLAWFMGVFYHLRYPMLGLDIVTRRVNRLLVFQSMTIPGEEVAEPPENFPLSQRSIMQVPGWPMMAFIEKRLANDPTNWWAANRACLEAMLRSSGMRVLTQMAAETYLCEPSGEPPAYGMADLLEHEFLAATGQLTSEGKAK